MKAKAVTAQARIETLLTIRRGESLLVTLVIPLGILVFFSSVDAVNTSYKDPVDFLVPGVLALAVMSSAMVSLGIATGYERRYGVLKRLGSTPSRRAGLLTAKTLNVLGLELLQAVADRPHRHRAGLGSHRRPAGRGAPPPGGHGGVRRHRHAARGHAAGRGQPRGGQRSVPRAAVPRRHGLPAGQAPRRGARRSPRHSRRPRCRRRCGRCSPRVARSPPASWSCSWCGRSRRPSPPPTGSAGKRAEAPRRSPRLKSSPQPFPSCSDTTRRSGQILIPGILAPKFTLRFSGLVLEQTRSARDESGDAALGR